MRSTVSPLPLPPPSKPCAPPCAGAPRVTASMALPSGKCLLQLWAERLLRLQQQAALATFGPNSPPTRPVHWYIATSKATHEPIQRALRQRHYYGLAPSQVGGGGQAWCAGSYAVERAWCAWRHTVLKGLHTAR